MSAQRKQEGFCVLQRLVMGLCKEEKEEKIDEHWGHGLANTNWQRNWSHGIKNTREKRGMQGRSITHRERKPSTREPKNMLRDQRKSRVQTIQRWWKIKTDGEKRGDREVKQAGRKRETTERQRRETDGGREEADRNSMGWQHWHSQRGTAGSMKSWKMSAEREEDDKKWGKSRTDSEGFHLTLHQLSGKTKQTFSSYQHNLSAYKLLLLKNKKQTN